MTQLYRIEELFSHGWELIEEDAKKLTREQCDALLQHYVASGANPKYLRAVYDND